MDYLGETWQSLPICGKPPFSKLSFPASSVFHSIKVDIQVRYLEHIAIRLAEINVSLFVLFQQAIHKRIRDRAQTIVFFTSILTTTAVFDMNLECKTSVYNAY